MFKRQAVEVSRQLLARPLLGADRIAVNAVGRLGQRADPGRLAAADLWNETQQLFAARDIRGDDNVAAVWADAELDARDKFTEHVVLIVQLDPDSAVRRAVTRNGLDFNAIDLPGCPKIDQWPQFCVGFEVAFTACRQILRASGPLGFGHNGPF